MIFRTTLTAALIAASAAAADPAAVWQRHLEAAGAGDIDAVMRDFDEASAIVTPGGVIVGTAGIRAFFEEILQGFPPEAAETIVVNAFHTHGDVVYFNATFPALGEVLQDVAVIEGETIRTLTTLSYPAP